MLVPSASQAQKRGTVEAYLLSATHFYEELEYERALKQLALARSVSGGVADDVLLSLYEGIILADLTRNEEADAAFRAALVLSPDAQLPAKVSPKVQVRFESMRQKVKSEFRALAAKRAAVQVQPPAAEVPAATRGDVPAPAPSALSTPAAVPAAQVRAGDKRGSRAWLPAAVGGALVVGGGVSYALARGEWGKLQGNDASLATLKDVERSSSRGRTYQAVALGLAGAGIVSLGVSAGMYLLGGPSEEAVSLGAATDGTSAFVFGRWP
ncbi:hypothetical protein [Pyxidicoccus sp. MSG2]|uniref:hypothetical protein n=1 Tax=Pyxidicoccus sp. MSG2 TaxID=2996790 RepID=UPI002271CC12|nr:hypothetical protein [Pyxidicoccus sp. MSG2]MCY1021773.1 hypothetical protein [Pyxidicoccus sp. MSG2]